VAYKPGDIVSHPIVGTVRVLSVNERGHLMTGATDRVAIFRALRPEDCRMVRSC
jgi:hypothetical protein